MSARASRSGNSARRVLRDGVRKSTKYSASRERITSARACALGNNCADESRQGDAECVLARECLDKLRRDVERIAILANSVTHACCLFVESLDGIGQFGSS